MLGLPFLKNSSKNLLDGTTNLIALDIGTEQLKSILFSMGDIGIDIKKISRIDQQQNAMSKGIITNLDTVLDNCRLSISELTSRLADEELPKNVVMGIAGEYIQGVSIIVNYQREENYDREVTQKEQNKIIGQIKAKIETNGKEDLGQRTGLRNEDIDILHITHTGLEIGGMPVDSLIGYKGREVKLHFYASFAPKTYTEALRKVAQELGLEVIGIVSQPFSVARAGRIAFTSRPHPSLTFFVLLPRLSIVVTTRPVRSYSEHILSVVPSGKVFFSSITLSSRS